MIINEIQEIVKSIIAEEANIENVTDAIKKRYEVEIDYDANDNNPKGKGRRLIQPVALGHSRAGILVLRAFEPYGDTETRVPHWKFFRLDRIGNWKGYKKRRFSEPPSEEKRLTLGRYNPNGDGSMIDVLVQADFSGSNAYAKGEGKYKGLLAHNVEKHRQKMEKEPYGDIKRNIQQAVNVGDVDYIRRNIDAWDKKEKEQDYERMEKWKKEHSNAPKYGKSIDNMKQMTNFGDEDNTQTVGPVTKDNYDATATPQRRELDYSEMEKSGPVYVTDNNELGNNNEETPEWQDEYEQFLSQYGLNNRRK